MTWDEFKSEVDHALAEAGKDGTISIGYIDISEPDQSHPRTAIAVSTEDGILDVSQ